MTVPSPSIRVRFGVPYSNGRRIEYRISRVAAANAGSLAISRANSINWVQARYTLETPVSENNPISIFVSHLFEEDADYLRVFEFLESVDRFYYVNVSKPENMPPSGGLDAIKEEYIAQINESEAVIVLASHFTGNLELLRYQLDVAEAQEKPIIVIRPFGRVDRTADELVSRVSEHVDWNSREIADAVSRQARLENTARWDVVDFP